MKDSVQDFKQQHFQSYQTAVYDTIENNTMVLVEDFLSLMKKPPLDSMDTLKVRLLDLAKKYQIVFNTESLDHRLEEYRKDLSSCCDQIVLLRKEKLNHLFSKYSMEDNDYFQFYKKDFLSINKEIKKMMKNQLVSSFEKTLVLDFSTLFDSGIPEDIQEKFTNELIKYYKGPYLRNFLDNCEIKNLVKDTTLMNSVKEHGERYLFTLNHSRLLNDL